MPDPVFNKVIIVGPGLIGGSVGMALRKRGLAGEVVGVGHRKVSIQAALELGAIDRGTLDITEAVPQADLVLLHPPYLQLVWGYYDKHPYVDDQRPTAQPRLDLGLLPRETVDAAEVERRLRGQLQGRTRVFLVLAHEETRATASRTTQFAGGCYLVVRDRELC